MLDSQGLLNQDSVSMKKIITPDCQDLMDQCRSANTIDEIHGICAKAAQLYGFDQFIYGGRISTSFVRPQLIIISGYRQDWWDYYNEKDYFKVDPVLSHCENNIMPIHWQDLSEKQLENELSKQVMNESTEFGLKNGISFPVHSPKGEFAILSFATDNTSKDIPSLLNYISPHLMLFTYHMHESVMRIFSDNNGNIKGKELTAREKECLLWAAEGKTSDETADILFISESTVRYHLNNAARKLNVHTRRHAIARAICLGVISPIFK